MTHVDTTRPPQRRTRPLTAHYVAWAVLLAAGLIGAATADRWLIEPCITQGGTWAYSTTHTGQCVDGVKNGHR